MNGLQERWTGIFCFRREKSRLQQCAKRRDLGREAAFLKPELHVPFTPGIIVQAGKNQAPLVPVGHQCQVFASCPQPAEDLADNTAPAADADAFVGAVKDREQRIPRTLPQLARLDAFAANSFPGPGRCNLVASRPDPGTGVKTADPLQHERDKRRGVPCFVKQFGAEFAQAMFGELVERRRGEARYLSEARAVKQQTAVAQALPAGQFNTHSSNSGNRISTATGNTWASPASE